MRSVIVIFLAVCCAAASVRIEGVWPPESISRQIEHTVDRIAAPGRLILALADPHRLPSGPTLPRPALLPAALSHSNVEKPDEQSRADLACG